MTAEMPTRAKSPSRLIRDAALKRWDIGDIETNSPRERRYPAMLAQLLCARSKVHRNRLYRWLDNPDKNPLDWHELCIIANELGGNLRCMFTELP